MKISLIDAQCSPLKGNIGLMRDVFGAFPDLTNGKLP